MMVCGLLAPAGRTLLADDPGPDPVQAAPSETEADPAAPAPAPTAGDPTIAEPANPGKTPAGADILDLDIDQLGKVQAKVPTAFDAEVTSVTAHKSSVGKSPP